MKGPTPTMSTPTPAQTAALADAVRAAENTAALYRRKAKAHWNAGNQDAAQQASEIANHYDTEVEALISGAINDGLQP